MGKMARHHVGQLPVLEGANCSGWFPSVTSSSRSTSRSRLKTGISWTISTGDLEPRLALSDPMSSGALSAAARLVSMVPPPPEAVGSGTFPCHGGGRCLDRGGGGGGRCGDIRRVESTSTGCSCGSGSGGGGSGNTPRSSAPRSVVTGPSSAFMAGPGSGATAPNGGRRGPRPCGSPSWRRSGQATPGGPSICGRGAPADIRPDPVAPRPAGTVPAIERAPGTVGNTARGPNVARRPRGQTDRECVNNAPIRHPS